MKRIVLAFLAALALLAPTLAVAETGGRWITVDLPWRITTQGRPSTGAWPASLTSIWTRDTLYANIDSALTGAADTTSWFNLKASDPAILPFSAGADSMIIGFVTLWSDSAAPATATATALNARIIVANPGTRQDTTGAKQILHLSRAITQTLTFTAGARIVTIPIYVVQRGSSGANVSGMIPAGFVGSLAVEVSNLVPSAVGGAAQIEYNAWPRVRATYTYYDNDH